MMPERKPSPNIQASRAVRMLPDLLAFGFGIGMAYLFHWETRDLVWSLWLSSLTIGYVTILSTIAGGVYLGLRIVRHEDFPAKMKTAALWGILGVALFFLGFFSLHFCAFHAGHASFLSSFFPIQGLPPERFSAAFMNPLLLWSTAFQYLFPLYGLFLLPILIAERDHVFASLTKALQLARRMGPDELKPEHLLAARQQAGKNREIGRLFYQPYLNVIRMHILIFFFAFAQAWGMEGFPMYALVYAVYFFPWGKLFLKTAKA